MKRTLLSLTIMMFCAAAVTAQVPTITSFSPSSGAVGDIITISGSGFSDTAANNIVRFGSVKAEVIMAATNSLTVTVPTGTSFAPITVTDTSSAKRLTAYSPVPFSITFTGLQTIDASSFAPRIDFSTSPGTSPRGVVAADIDGDGRPDVVVTNPSSGTIGIYRNIGSVGGIGSSSFATRVEYSLGSAPYGIAFGDLDGDGDLDLAVTDTSNAKVYVWQNASAPGTVDTSSVTAHSVGTKPFGVAIADLDGDGRPDIVTANKGSNNVSILRNTTLNGIVAFASEAHFATGSGPVDIVIADVDNNPFFEPDIITANTVGNSVTVLQNNSTPANLAFNSAVTPLTGSGSMPSGIVAADFDGDGLIDIATANSGTTKISVIRNSTLYNLDIAFDAKDDFETGGSPIEIIAANIEGDEKSELVLSFGTLDSIAVLRNTSTSGSIATGSFAGVVCFVAPAGQAEITAVDFDCDGKPDLVTANTGANSISLFRNKAVKLELESNDLNTGANPIVIGETIQGDHSSATDVDRFRFFAFAGDTLEVYVNRHGTSNAAFQVDVSDSLEQWVTLNNRWSSRCQFPSAYNIHVIFPINETKTYYLRIMHPDNWDTSLTGGYRARLERFVPSAPDLNPGWSWRTHYNSSRLSIEASPNGLPTTALVEWGQSPASLTNTVSTGDVHSDISLWNTDVLVSGLSPNQRYYCRWTATNSAGTTQGDISMFETPPAPVGWEILEIPPPGSTEGFNGVSFPPGSTTGYAIGGWNRVLKTTDGGRTWFDVPFPRGWLGGVSFSLPSTGLIVGEGGLIYKTIDGGSSWNEKTSNIHHPTLFAVRYFDAQVAIAVGEGGYVMRSTDSWETWDTVWTGTTQSLRDISVVNQTTAFVVGFNGTILRTADAGATWTTIPSGTTNWLWGAHFFNATTGFVVGDGMTYRKTTNAGASWTELVEPTDLDLFKIAFKDAYNGLIVGRSGRMVRTTDGGTTWQHQYSGTYSNLNATAFAGRTAAVVGDHGIMTYIDPAKESEPNDSIAAATPVEYRDDIEADIQLGDIDYYAITSAAGDTIEISTVALDSIVVNGTLELLDGGENLLVQNDDYVPGDSVQSRIVYVIPSSGIYYARYSSTSGLTTGNYKIRFRESSLRPSIPYAGLASIHTSTSVTLAAPVVSNNINTNVEFEYGLTLLYGSTVQAVQNPIMDLQLTTATADLVLEAEKEYHFRVKASNAAGVAYGPDVTFITSTGTTRSEIEPNNLANHGNTIFIGDTVNAFLSSTADADYYRFQAKAGDTLEVFVRAGVVPNPYSNWSDPHLLRFEVVDSTNGSGLVWNDVIPHPANLHSTIIANNTGIYHIRVSSRNISTSYPNAVPDAGEPQIQPGGIASSDTASYQLRLRRFEPSAPDVRFDHWFVLTLHDSAVMYVEIQPNGLPTTFTLQYGRSEPFTESIVYSGASLTGVYPVGVYVPMYPLQASMNYGARVIASNALGTDTNAVRWEGMPNPPEGWVTRPVTTRPNIGLSDVALRNEHLGIAVGSNELMRTTDGGNTWVWAQNPGVSAGGIGFANDTIATVAGGGFARTTNAGASWVYQSNIDNWPWIARLDYASETVGYAVGERGRITKTTDAGVTWNNIRMNAQYLNGLHILHPDTVYVAGDNGTILRTRNGGSTWDSLLSGTTKRLYDIAFINSEKGFAVGQEGMVKRTTDGGTTWSTVIMPVGNWLCGVEFRDSLRGIIVGHQGTILRTTDGGTTWVQQQSGTYNNFSAVSYVGRRAVALDGYGVIARYLDPYDEPEPNNTIAQAFTLPYGEKLDGIISPADDIDFYKFTAAAGDTIEIRSTNRTGSQLNAYLELLNSSEIVVASNDNFVPNDSTQARVVYAVTGGGMYYIRLSSASVGGTGEYLLELQKTSLSPMIISTASSNITPMGATLTAVVVPNNLSTSIQYQWGTEGTFDHMVPGTAVDGQQQCQSGIDLSGLAPFTQYNFRVLVTNSAGSSLSDAVSFMTPRATALAEIESNDDAQGAQFMTLTDTVAATLFPSSDVDYYKFHGEIGDTVEFQAVGNSTWYNRLRMLLIDSANYIPATDPNRIENEYFDEGWFPAEYGLWQSRVLDRTSTYYVIIFNDEGFNDSDTTSYWIHIRKFAPSTPVIQNSSWTHVTHSNLVVLSTHVAPRGLKTTVTYEYGPTADLGTTVTAFGHPHQFLTEINGYWYGQVFTPPITNLQPSSRYYMRATATNSAGSATQAIGEFWTAAAADGWNLVPTSGYSAGRRISFPTQDIGYLVGHMGNVFKTTDGGASWAKTGLGLTMHDHFEGISFLNPDTGIGVGQGPRIFRTSDGGNTWSYVWQHELAFSGQLYDVELLDATTAVAVSADAGGTIVRTTDGGATWSVVALADRGIRAVCFSPAQDTGYAVGDKGIAFRSTDRGQSWQEFQTPDSAELRDVWFFDGTRGLAVGYPHTIIRTSDAGNSWTTIPHQQHSWWHQGIAFADSLNGIIVGDGGDIYRSNDGGLTWTWEESGTWNGLTAVAFSGRRAILNSDGGFALTAVGLLARPANVTASKLHPRYVHLTWNDVERETGYFVGRKDSSDGTYFRVRTVDADTISIIDTVMPGRTYYYKVQSFSAVDTSLYSAEASVLVELNNPHNLTATALGKTRVQLAWQNEPDARLGYIIERHVDGPWAVIDTVGDVTTFVDSTAGSGTTYTYQVQSYNAEMKSSYSNEAAATTPGLVTAPSSVTASFAAPNLINVSWLDNSSNETGFWVEKKTGAGGTYAVLSSVGANVANTKDTVQLGRIYYYRVRGYSSADTSSYAAEDSALAPLCIPGDFAASAMSSSSIMLTWNTEGDARTGYKLERKTGVGGSFGEIATLPFPAGSDNAQYTDVSLNSGARYYYRMRSYNSEMYSSYSAQDSALTALGKPQNITADPATVTNKPITVSWSGPEGATHYWFGMDHVPSMRDTLTGKSFVFTWPPGGSHWIFVALENAEGIVDLSEYDSVQILQDFDEPQITDQTTLPTITITSGSVSDPASVSFQVSVTSPGIASMLNPRLEYKKTNSNTVTSVPFPSTNGGTVNVASLNSLFLTIGKPNGVEYRITASDAAGNMAETAWHSFLVYVITPPVSDFVPPAAGTGDDISTLVTNYRLFSVPYYLQDKKPVSFMETVDKGLGPHAKEGVNYYYWRMQRYVNGTYQDYEDFKNEDALMPGAAFFMLSREQKSISVGTGTLVKAQEMYEGGIQVLQGWNLVGNPFPDDLPSDSLFVVSGSIADKAYYDGTGPDGGWWKSGTQAQTLKKWEGLAVNVTENTSLRFKAVPPQLSEEAIPPPLVQLSAVQAIEEKKEGGWLVKFDAHRSGSTIADIGNTIGEVPGANEGYDRFDSFQPPLIPGKSLALYFKNSVGAMSSDIRPIRADGSTWEMKAVTGDRGSRVRLNVAEIMPLSDPSLFVFLLDLDDHMAYNLRERHDLEFGSKEGTRSFKVVVGSKAFVDSVSSSLGIDLVPRAFMLYQNYPNPFNPETVIRYTIPGEAPAYRVSLKVYNIIGQEVATLVDRDQLPGYYEVTMNARGLSSGTYICRLEASGGAGGPNYSQVRKMMLVK